VCSEKTTLRKQRTNDKHLIGDERMDETAYTVSGASSSSCSNETVFPASIPMSKTEMKTLTAGKPFIDCAVCASRPDGNAQFVLIVSHHAGCLRYLDAAISDNRTLTSFKEAMKMAAYLVTGMLLLTSAPRSQVLAALRIGSTFTRETETGRYWVRLKSEQSKNCKPILLVVPDVLSKHIDHYISNGRETIIAKSSNPGSDGAYLFLKRDSSGPRKQFSEWTRYVTKKVIGRAISAHTFRSSLITNYYQSGASEAEMVIIAQYTLDIFLVHQQEYMFLPCALISFHCCLRQITLARVMAHDSTTARQYYYRPIFKQSVLDTNRKMEEMLLEPPT
jgi:hypothetical protein